MKPFIRSTTEIDSRLTEDKNSEQSEQRLLSEDEIKFALNYMERIEKHPITRHEIVLIAVPLSNDNWVEVVDACIYTDARFIISGFEIDATSLATTIIQEGVTIVATTSQVWLQIYHELSTVPDFRVDQLRIILLDSLA